MRHQKQTSKCTKEKCLQLASLSGPMTLGGLGKLRMTNFASCDFATMTSLSLTAVCILRTLEDSLTQIDMIRYGKEVIKELYSYLPFVDGTVKELAPPPPPLLPAVASS